MSSSGVCLSVIVLAGGHSRRMGEDKALLTHRGQSLLSHTIQVAQQLSSDVLLVTPWPERYQASLPNAVQYVPEASQQPSAGPLSGFAQGWQQTKSDWCLLLACDLPYLEATVLQQWWRWILSGISSGWPHLSTKPAASLVLSQIPPNEGETTTSNTAASNKGESNKGTSNKSIGTETYSQPKKRWQPLCGYYHRSCLVSLQQQLATPKRSFQTWLSTLPIARYSAVPSAMLFNCNTPADWDCVITSSRLGHNSL